MGPTFDPAPATALCALRARSFNRAQLAVLRSGVGRDLLNGEFSAFMETAVRAGLDPFRRHIVPLVIARKDPERRRMIPITTIDGLRAIAARSGDYRPMETPARIVTRTSLKDVEVNPLGIERAVVKVWKRTEDGWRPVAGEAYWEEFAPLRPPRTAAPGEPAADRLPHAWRRMGRVMIAKCAEAQALRRGWPEALGGLYGQEEMDREWLRETEPSLLGASMGDSLPRNVEDGVAANNFAEVLLEADGQQPTAQQTQRQAGTTALEGGRRACDERDGLDHDRLIDAFSRCVAIDELERLEAASRSVVRGLWDRNPVKAHAIKVIAAERRARLMRTSALLNRSPSDDQ